MNKLSWLIMASIIGIVSVWPAQISAAGAKLNWEQKQLVTLVGKQEQISLELDPGGAKVVGVDAVIKYDPNKIKVIKVVEGNLFPGEAVKLIDNANGVMKIGFSNPYGKFVTQRGKLATVTIEAKTVGLVDLTFDYRANNTADTNVVAEHGVDVLQEVSNLSLKVEQKGNTTRNKAEERSSEVLGEVAEDEQINGEIPGPNEVNKNQLPNFVFFNTLPYIGGLLSLTGGLMLYRMKRANNNPA